MALLDESEGGHRALQHMPYPAASVVQLTRISDALPASARCTCKYSTLLWLTAGGAAKALQTGPSAIRITFHVHFTLIRRQPAALHPYSCKSRTRLLQGQLEPQHDSLPSTLMIDNRLHAMSIEIDIERKSGQRTHVTISAAAFALCFRRDRDCKSEVS